MVIFATIGAVLGTIVHLTCPHCGATLARARGQQRHRCSKCHRYFNHDEGAAPAAGREAGPHGRR